MKIVYTKHAKRKFEFHKKLGWTFSRQDIRVTIQRPYFSEVLKERGAKSAMRRLDPEHDLRVIYKEEDGIITILTFYPTEKRRYAI